MTRYRLAGPGIEFLWVRDFPHPSLQTLRPTQISVEWTPDIFTGLKVARGGVDQPALSSAEVKEIVEL